VSKRFGKQEVRRPRPRIKYRLKKTKRGRDFEKIKLVDKFVQGVLNDFRHWHPVKMDNRYSAVLLCPKCYFPMPLGKYSINNRTGKVTPSVVCSWGCGYHRHVVLKGWKKFIRERTKDNEATEVTEVTEVKTKRSLGKKRIGKKKARSKVRRGANLRTKAVGR